MTRAAPELILLACEVKVAARRGLHLISVYGRSSCVGRLAAWARRSQVEAKYAAVTQRLQGLMPAGPASGGPSPTSRDAAAHASGLAASARDGIFAASSSGGGAGLRERTAPGKSGDGGAAAGGQVLRRGRHERVYCVAFSPPSAAAASGGLCAWWALESAVEFYSDAAQATTSFAIEGDVRLTHVAIDPAGNTWGGTNTGTLLVRRPFAWDIQAEERLFGGAVRAIAFDASSGRVWAGDDNGCLRAAHLHADTWHIEALFTAAEGGPARRATGSILLRGSSSGYAMGWLRGWAEGVVGDSVTQHGHAP